MADIFSIGLGALNAAEIGITTTGQNIANASTPGYSRQEVLQSAAQPQSTSYGFLGGGVQVDSIARVYNQFLVDQSMSAQAQAASYNTYYSQAQPIDQMLSDQTSGLQPAIQGFFTSLQSVANSPQSIPARQAFLSNAQSLVSQINGAANTLTNTSNGINNSITSTIQNINSLATQVANLNQQILQLQTAANNNPPNDLLDQRQQLISQINQQIGVKTVTESNGNVDLFIGSGQSLVIGNRSMTLKAAPDPANPTNTEVAYVLNGATGVLPSSTLTGGNLGGMLQFRNQTLETAQNAIGQLAVVMSQTLNQQNQLGMDLNGNLGGNLFVPPPAPQVLANASNTTPASALTVSISNASQLQASDYRLSYDGTNYTITRLSDNTSTTYPNTTTFPISLDGMNITVNTAPNPGESFLIRPVASGASSMALAITDPAKVAAANPIATSASSANIGNATISPATITAQAALAEVTPPVVFTYNATTNALVDNQTPSTSIPYVSGQSITYKGNVTFTVTGQPQNNDTFTLQSNAGATGDNTNALAMAGMETQNLVQGTTSFEGAFGQLISLVGTNTSSANVNGQSQQALYQQIQNSQQSVSGVNLDEEAANLLKYQQNYQAAGKLLSISSQLFQSLLQI
ncbi:MAG TPA: flagellar hook-associated protein FlgK [Burkholderiales bacterium]|nr:flagellar hook-associated protein FlgK [Burkholderiales bacterium]